MRGKAARKNAGSSESRPLPLPYQHAIFGDVAWITGSYRYRFHRIREWRDPWMIFVVRATMVAAMAGLRISGSVFTFDHERSVFTLDHEKGSVFVVDYKEGGG
jgi:hypothetical protein